MKNEHKVILVKCFIALSAFLMVVTMIFGFLMEFQVEGTSNYYLCEKILTVVFSMFFISAVTMMILMFKIDIRPQKTKSEKIRLITANYEELKKVLANKILEDGFTDLSRYESIGYSIEYSVKHSFQEEQVIGIIKVPELTKDIYTEYVTTCFEDFGNYLLNNNKIKDGNFISFICVICVDRVTKIFSEYTENNVKQPFGRCLVPIGVSFGSKTLYIVTQKSGLYKGKHTAIVGQFKKYIDNQIEK